MKKPVLHEWDMPYAEAISLQKELAGRVVLRSLSTAGVRLVAGVDASYEKGGEEFFAGIVVLGLPGFTLIEERTARAKVSFPYIPGLLSFRELPVLLKAWEDLETVPDAVLVDGQGIAHPRRLGLASHLGLWLDLPTVGCAKSRLCGEFEEPGPEKGDVSPLLLHGERVGTVLRTRKRVRPLFVSPGHLVDVPTAERIALACCDRYRMPEPTRLAHLLTNRVRREAGSAAASPGC